MLEETNRNPPTDHRVQRKQIPIGFQETEANDKYLAT